MARRSIAAVTLVLALAVAPPALAADDQVVITGDVKVPAGETVGDVFVFDGSVDIAGRADGDVVIVIGSAHVSGTVDGDLVTVSADAVLTRGARVEGDLRYGDEEPEIAPGATVTGEVTDEGWRDLSGVPWGFIGHIAIWAAVTTSTLILGLLMLLLAPRVFESAERVARQSFWVAIAVGAGVFVLVPVAAVIAIATLVGIPFGMGLLLALLPLAAVAYVTAAHVLGARILSGESSPWARFLLGWGILRALAFIPAFGVIAWFVATVIGLGLLAIAIWETRRPRAPAAAAPAQ